jgi:hypothetical protein
MRAKELAFIKNKNTTSYNSNKFKILYLLSIFIIFFGLFGLLFYPPLWFIFFILYIIFFNINLKLYEAFYKNHGLFFFIKAVIIHYFYILSISISGVLGLICGKLSKNKSYEL